MELPVYTSLVTLLIALYYLWVGIHVSLVRGKVKIHAPAVSGDPQLERALRVQMNAVEHAPAILPALCAFPQPLFGLCGKTEIGPFGNFRALASTPPATAKLKSALSAFSGQPHQPLPLWQN